MRLSAALVILFLCLAACANGDQAAQQTWQGVQPDPSRTVPPLFPITSRTAGKFQETACRFTLPEDVEQGTDISCGFLSVPEQRDHPESRLIQLHVAVLHRPGGTLHKDPVFFLAGGPGYSPLEGLHAQYEVLTQIAFATGRDLVVFDQRGVGLSQPALDCPEYDQWSIELLDREIENRQVSETEIYQLIENSIITCSQKLQQEADLSAYNSEASADDVYDLQSALGYELINLWGGSYGSRLALEVMRRHPDGLRSVVLEAVYPPNVDLFVEAPANFSRSLEKMFNSCAENASCKMHFPDLRNVFFETAARLDAQPEKTEIVNVISGDKIQTLFDGNALLGITFQLLYDSTWRYALPKHIYAISQGDYADFNLVRSIMVSRLGYSSRGMMFSVLCHEEMPFSSQSDFHAEQKRHAEIAGMYEQSVLGELAYRVCPQWGAGEADASANQPVKSAVSTLILSGEYDPITPPAWGQVAAETLDNAYIFEFPGLGHGVSGKSGCPQQIITDFWSNPTVEPDGSCLKAVP